LNTEIKNIWKVIINPQAGGNTDAGVWEKILLQLKEARIAYDYELSKHHQHIIDIVYQSIAKGFRKFIVIGGDGSLNEVANGIYNQSMVSPTEITTAHISLGTGNDWHKTHKLPVEPHLMIQKIKSGKTSAQDVGLVTFQDDTGNKMSHFVNVAGMGFDAFVVLNTREKKEKKNRSRFAYLYSLFRSLLRYKCLPARVYIDGTEVFYDRLFSFNVGIGKYNGGGMMQLPEAVADDGLLDITLFRKMPKIKVIFNIKKLYNGTFTTMKEVSLFKGQNIVLHSDHPIALECDGELMGHSPATFSIIPLGFRYIC